MPDIDLEEELEENPEEESPRKGGLILPLVVALLALGGGGGVGTMFLGPAVAPMLVSDPSEKPKSKGGGHGGGGHGEVVTNLLTVDNLVVNPARSGGTRFLLVSVALELEDPSLLDGIAARDVELRDALIRCLGMKTVDELADVGRREALMAEIKSTLDHVVGAGAIHRIFLPQFVIQ